MTHDFEVAVVGGGAAGLSAALVLGRARLPTLVVDAGAPSNGVAAGVGGLLGHDGRPPAELYAAGREELARYPDVTWRAGEVVGGERRDGGFALALDGGAAVTARRVLLATGMEYRHPDVPGVAERWGRSVFHCPFCHGWEVRERPLGVLDASPRAVHRALLLQRWSDDVTLLTDGPARLGDGERSELEAAGVTVDERPVAALRGPGETLEAVVFDDGSERAVSGLLAGVTLHQRSSLAEQLGADAAEPRPPFADPVQVDGTFATSVPGLSAAGDLTGTSMPFVANAIAAGSTAATLLVHALVAEPPPVASPAR